MNTDNAIGIEEVWKALENVKDPEIPTLSVVDLAVITQVSISGSGDLELKFMPTFVGCPALEIIRKNIEAELLKLPFHQVNVIIDRESVWSTDLLSQETKNKLEFFGLAPPAEINGELDEEALNKVRCPHCGSTDTSLRSPFGSTLCRAIRFCYSCKQGFEQFKPL